MSDLIERSKGVQLRGNTQPRDAFLLEEMRERICELEDEVTELRRAKATQEGRV